MKLPKSLTDLFSTSKADLAQQEIDQTKANVKRLEDLADFHQGMADRYRLGVREIRQPPVVINTEAANAKEVTRHLGGVAGFNFSDLRLAEGSFK